MCLIKPAPGRPPRSLAHPNAAHVDSTSFGRIGRLVLRATLHRKDVNVVAINGVCCWAAGCPCQHLALGKHMFVLACAAVATEQGCRASLLPACLPASCPALHYHIPSDPFIEAQYAAYMFKVCPRRMWLKHEARAHAPPALHAQPSAQHGIA